jgi:hypothetical protein
MRDQLNHLADMSESLEHVNVQVLPFTAGAHPAMEGKFAILTFPESRDPEIVYLENHAGSLYLEEDDQIGRYNLMHQHLTVMALAPEDSRALIRAVARDLER